MNRLIPLLLSFLFFFSVTQLHAGAAEKWEYDVIPDQSQRLQVKGHKVDQYGAAVNDYEYNTKIDPKTTANRVKMGTVGFGRLLKTTGWGLLGSAALEALLEAVDWVIDPSTQSIWRNKADDRCIVCTLIFKYHITFSGGNFIPKESYSNKQEVEDALAPYFPKDDRYVYKWDKVAKGSTQYNPNNETEVLYIFDPWGYNTGIQAIGESIGDKLPEKEYLTPEQLADYANHTHPDYSNPELAPKLEPKYSPEIQTDLWKPSNPWEETNSPTVQEVTRQLEQAQPEPKTDPELTPNPETGGTTLPPFCSWAAPVCEFIKWIKEPPESPESIDVPEKEIDKQEIKKDLVTLNVRSCPADIKFDVQNLPFGIQVNKGVQMQPICDTIEPLKYVFQLITFVFCGFILLRV